MQQKDLGDTFRNYSDPWGALPTAVKYKALHGLGYCLWVSGVWGVKILSSSTTGPKSVQIYIEKEKDLTYKAKKFSRSPIGITISMLLGLSGKV